MSINTANTQDGRGVLIYNGEMILLYIEEIILKFDTPTHGVFKGKKVGNLYLTTHRVIFISTQKDEMRSFSMPFHCLRFVNLKQPIFGANYIIGIALAQPGSGYNEEISWRLIFKEGGCIDFGKALLKANDMANNFRPHNAPPQYTPPTGAFYSAPPAYYTVADQNYYGFELPHNVFPNAPPAGNVFMFEEPPPYTGIGPNFNPHQFNNFQPVGNLTPNNHNNAHTQNYSPNNSYNQQTQNYLHNNNTNQNVQNYPNNNYQAGQLPQKPKVD